MTMNDEFERFRPKASTTARPTPIADLTTEQKRQVAISRMLWRHELDTIRTSVQEQDTEPCVLCGTVIPEGPAWFITDSQPFGLARVGKVIGYIGGCCYDLAIFSGVTRAEVAARGGRPSHLGRVVEIPTGCVIELAERVAISNQRKAER